MSLWPPRKVLWTRARRAELPSHAEAAVRDLPVPLLGTAPPLPGSHTALPLRKGTEGRSHSGCDRARGLMNTRVRSEAGARRASAPSGDLLPRPQEFHATRRPSSGGVGLSSPSVPTAGCGASVTTLEVFDPDSALCGVDRHPGSGVQRPGSVQGRYRSQRGLRSPSVQRGWQQPPNSSECEESVG